MTSREAARFFDRFGKVAATAVLAGVACAGCSGGPGTAGPQSAMLRQISENELRDFESGLTAIGIRDAGSAGEVAARDFIATTLGANPGIEITEPPFDYVLWRDGGLDMSLDGPEGGAVPGGSLAFSTATPPEGITAQMVYVGTGTQPEYAMHSRRELEGKIHLVDTSEDANRALQYLNAQVFGAVGFIEMKSWKGEHGEPLVELGAVQPFATIPAVSVDQDTGARLKRNASQRLTIHSTNSTAPAQSVNVIGVLPGRPGEDDYVTVSAHLDSLATSLGAIDDGSGIVGLLEIAKVLASSYDLERSVHFAFFSAEEQNLQGSFQYVIGQNSKDIREHCRLMVEIDVAGIAGGESIIAAEPAEVGQQGLDDMTSIDFTKKTGSPASISDSLDPGSDVLWYIALGVPTYYETKSPFIYYHTPYDTPDRMDFNSLRYEVAVDAQMIADAAGATPRTR